MLLNKQVKNIFVIGLKPWRFIKASFLAAFHNNSTLSPLEVFVGLVSSPIMAVVGLMSFSLCLLAILFLSCAHMMARLWGLESMDTADDANELDVTAAEEQEQQYPVHFAHNLKPSLLVRKRSEPIPEETNDESILLEDAPSNHHLSFM